LPFQTNTNVPPYVDDYDESKDFHKILFKPGVSVQARELNQMQTIMQKQIERFGDNIFKQGTIVSGCNFIFYPAYAYVKILDTEVDGTVAVVSNYRSQFIINETSGLKGSIQTTINGFESTNPDLKTLYVTYLNSGFNGNTASFASNDVLKIYDLNRSIYKVNITDGGAGFSNTDNVVVSPRLIVNVASGSFANGDYVTNNLGANVQIINVDNVTYAAQQQICLTVRPTNAILALAASNSTNWTITGGQSITNQANTVAARCEGVIGGGARIRAVTDGIGKVIALAILARGQQYTFPPYVSIQSANNTSGISALSLIVQNYIATVTVAPAVDAVGNGYAFSVSDGVVYQRGAFLRVTAQSAVVSKYSQKPDKVSIGFTSTEEIIDSNQDTSLLDNSEGLGNATAPGADRLKVTPTLLLVSSKDAEANAEFFTLAAWSEGMPYKQNQVSSYDVIGDVIATRTKEESGNYVVDSFLLSTRSPVQANMEGGYYSSVIDPGTAYINGYRVSTRTNFAIDVPKPTTTLVSNNQHVNLNYGNYVFVNQLGGTFLFNTGDVVSLYDTATGFLNNTSGFASITPSGTLIGTARIRSLIPNTGTPGTPAGTFRMYLFQININPGQSFARARSIAYSGTRSGICDIVTTLNGSTGGQDAVLQESSISNLLFATGVDSMTNANGVNYTYRTMDLAVTVANNGILTKSISARPDEVYPYTSALTQNQLRDLVVVPTAQDLVFTTNVTGTVAVTSTSAVVVGTGSSFGTDLQAGDYVYAYTAGGNTSLRRVVSVVNNTYIVLNANLTFSNTSCGIARVFPLNVPIPLGTRSGISANVASNQTTLTINLGTTFQFSGSTAATLAYNTQRSNVTHSTKQPNRIQYVKLNLSTSSITGPWCLGVPDIFRLRGVYVGDSTVTNTATNSVTSFYIDHNQNPDFLDLGWLYIGQKAPISLTSANYLLVEFDYFTGSGVGYYDPTSYVGSNTALRLAADSLTLSSLTTKVNSFEVPELFNDRGDEFDLLQYFDFRPSAVATVTPSSTPAGAPVDPSSIVSFGNTSNYVNDLKFPLPGSEMVFNVEQYLGRTDAMFVHQDATIEVVQGKPDVVLTKRFSPSTPQDAMKLTDLTVPPYPCLPIVRGTNITQILNTRVTNGKYLKVREDSRAVSKPQSQTGAAFSIPKVYTMADIGHIDRRLQDVEYYVSLNMLESNTVNLAIPSSTDPSLNRFKYGFFADDLSTYAYSDRDNPSYQAYIEDNAAVPEKLNWDMYLNGVIGGPDYIDFQIVSQENASWPDTLGPVCVLQYVTYNIVTVANTTVLQIPDQPAVQVVFTNNPLYFENNVDQSAGSNGSSDGGTGSGTGSSSD
jgi:hypothetical protein